MRGLEPRCDLIPQKSNYPLQGGQDGWVFALAMARLARPTIPCRNISIAANNLHSLAQLFHLVRVGLFNTMRVCGFSTHDVNYQVTTMWLPTQ